MASLLEHYRIPASECASQYESTLWRRKQQLSKRGAPVEVWLEENDTERRSRVVKTVRYTSSRSQSNSAVCALVNLSQRRYRPFVAEFLGFHEDASSLSLFMEYFPLRDLRRHLPIGAGLTEIETKTIARQLLHGISALHEQHLVHHNLGPESLFVVSTNPWKIKLGEFGVASMITDERAFERTYAAFGPYQAPEICGLSAYEDTLNGHTATLADVWSIGAILFELLTGERPFPTHAKLRAYCAGQYPFPESSFELDGISTVGTDLVRRLLKAHATERPSADTALQHTWLNVRPGSHRPLPMRSTRRVPSSPSVSPRLGTSERAESVLIQGSPYYPPAKPLPTPPLSAFPSRSSSMRMRDEGYYTSSDLDIHDTIDALPPPISPKSERRRMHEWRSNVNASIDEDLPFNYHAPTRSSPPPRRVQPEPPFSFSRTPRLANASPAVRETSSVGALSDDGAAHGARDESYHTGSTRNPHSYSFLPNSGNCGSIAETLAPSEQEGVPNEEPPAENDDLGPLSSVVEPLEHSKPYHLSRSMTSRSESALSMQSATSSLERVRESVNDKIQDGKWRPNDVVIVCEVSRWDLIRISAHQITSTSPLVFTETLHKNYINELPKLIFDALKPWFADNLGIHGVGKALAKHAKTYQERILDEILPHVDLNESGPEFFTMRLPEFPEVIEISKNIHGGALRVPSSTVRQVITDHWSLYIDEYINGFLHNERATGTNYVRAVVFDEPAAAYTKHEDFYRVRLEKKLWKGIEYVNYHGFARFAERTAKVKLEKKKTTTPKPKKGGFGRWKLK
ncbi:hypothetical protein B9Z65_7286 [Elsinoe australis]|uniref:Protein kinase domain-containing protein n=1 Tax=Elsinoe australis TaxID=40998 RepID=A0A2P7Z6B4_9PEZI|nr:hypothetical protein B9Z65_7286 [Elsinoe australis]